MFHCSLSGSDVVHTLLRPSTFQARCVRWFAARKGGGATFVNNHNCWWGSRSRNRRRSPVDLKDSPLLILQLQMQLEEEGEEIVDRRREKAEVVLETGEERVERGGWEEEGSPPPPVTVPSGGSEVRRGDTCNPPKPHWPGSPICDHKDQHENGDWRRDCWF